MLDSYIFIVGIIYTYVVKNLDPAKLRRVDFRNLMIGDNEY